MSVGRTLVMGDVHGNYPAMRDVLNKVKLNPTDRLFFLGDVCDGYPDPLKCMKRLNRDATDILVGNHDKYLWRWVNNRITSQELQSWFSFGGRNTLEELFGVGITSRLQIDPEGDNSKNLVSVNEYFSNIHLWRDVFISGDPGEECYFVHAGIPTKRLQDFSNSPRAALQGVEDLNIEHHDPELLWDRTLAHEALTLYLSGRENKKLTWNARVIVGHTPTIPYSDRPIEAGGVVLMDTGAGYPEGRLSVMCVETGEVWQSEKSKHYYPDHPGRLNNG